MSIWMTDLADVLRAAGLPVVEVPGWQERGSTYRGGQRDVKGIVCHHTATPDRFPGDYPTYAWIRDGGPGLPGPVANLGLGRSGVWYIFAAGRANHAGPVFDRYRTTYGNGYSIGIEAENSGLSPDWPTAQYDSYARGVAALSLHYKVPFESHKNVRPGKVDPSFPWEPFVARVEAEKKALTTPESRWTTPEGDDPTHLSEGHEHPKVAEVQAWVMGKWAWARAILTPAGGADGKYGPATTTLVATLQQRLNSQAAREEWAGWTPLDVDGKWGPATEAAAKSKSGFRRPAPKPKTDIEEEKPVHLVLFPTGEINSMAYGLGLEKFARSLGYSVNCGPSDALSGKCAPGKHPHGDTSEHFAYADGREGWGLDVGRNPDNGARVSAFEKSMVTSLFYLVIDLSGGALADKLVLDRAVGDHDDHGHIQGRTLRTKRKHFNPSWDGIPAGWVVYGHGSPALSGGDRADEVKALQRALGVKADGSFRLGTWHALREAQAKAGLTVDGIAGKATFGALGVTR